MQNVSDSMNPTSAPTPSKPPRGGLSGIIGKLLKNIRGSQPQNNHPDEAENDARPGFILESDRYTKASWERQGSGWM